MFGKCQCIDPAHLEFINLPGWMLGIIASPCERAIQVKQAASLLIQRRTLNYTHLDQSPRWRAWISRAPGKETLSCLCSSSPSGFKMKWIFFNPITNASEKSLLHRRYRKSLFQNVNRCHFCYVSIYSLWFHSFCRIELWAFKVRITMDLSIHLHTYYCALFILGAQSFCCLHLYCQQTMPIIF